jgi:hypothetical protein
VGFSEIKDSLQRRRTSENPQKAKFAEFLFRDVGE